MSYIKTYKDLIVWQKSMEVVEIVFKETKSFPGSELYGLVSQMKRAAVSIPSNIAEGFGRNSPKEFAQFYSISYGSALELETQLIIAKRIGYLNEEGYKKITALLNEVLKILNKMVFINRENAKRKLTPSS